MATASRSDTLKRSIAKVGVQSTSEATRMLSEQLQAETRKLVARHEKKVMIISRLQLSTIFSPEARLSPAPPLLALSGTPRPPHRALSWPSQKRRWR